MSEITEQEAKEAGVPIALLQKWNDVMQSLWTYAISNYKSQRPPAEQFFPKQFENEIYIGGYIKIKVNMVNKSYLDIVVDSVKEDHQLLSLRHFDMHLSVRLAFDVVNSKLLGNIKPFANG